MGALSPLAASLVPLRRARSSGTAGPGAHFTTRKYGGSSRFGLLPSGARAGAPFAAVVFFAATGSALAAAGCGAGAGFFTVSGWGAAGAFCAGVLRAAPFLPLASPFAAALFVVALDLAYPGLSPDFLSGSVVASAGGASASPTERR